MADLISRATAIKKFAEKREVWYGNGPLPSNESLMWQAAMSITEELPAVDAVPVVHGRWTERHVDYASDCAIDEVQTAKCSVCGLYHTTPYLYSFTDYKFCPHCGAKMDGKEAGT